jgi:hypothetical protein
VLSSCSSKTDPLFSLHQGLQTMNSQIRRAVVFIRAELYFTESVIRFQTNCGSRFRLRRRGRSLPMPHSFCEAAPEGRLGVRQLAAAFAFSLAILTHPKAQASLRTPRASPPLKKYAALGETAAFRGRRCFFKNHAALGVFDRMDGGIAKLLPKSCIA